ncbi:MAG: hypothetical protein L3J74_17860, partial [Bacteroidales bacterium]|nr:hypothetical protein [Bacteroidales bacterium]
MKKEVILLMIATLFLSYCSNQENNFIKKLIEKNKAYQSIHFKANQKYYYSNGIDTTFTPFELWAVRDSEDSKLGAYVWADNN